MGRQIFNYIFLVFLFNTLNAQNTVHLSIIEEGRGVLRSRGSECFIVAPYHLIQNAETRTITITGENQKTSTGKFIKSYPGDIAIIRIEKGANQDCTEWKISKSFTTLLKNSYEGFLEIRNDDGSFDHEPMYFKKQTDQGITIQAKDPSFEFAKGMSGSSLFSNIKGENMLFGLLMQIDSLDNTVGHVFQFDDIDRIIQEFFYYDQNNNVKINKWIAPVAGYGFSLTSISLGYFYYYAKAKNTYKQYEMYQTETNFLANVNGFSSRSEAFKEVEILRKKAVTLELIGCAGAIITSYLLYTRHKRPKDSKFKVTSVNNNLSLVYNF